MPNSFDNYDMRAKGIVAFAQTEARRFKHSYVGVDLLLLGVAKLAEHETRATSSRMLAKTGVEPSQIQVMTENLISFGDRKITEDVSFTQSAEKVFTCAQDESKRLGYSYVGSGQLFLAIARCGTGTAQTVLSALNLGFELLGDLFQEVSRDLDAEARPPYAKASDEEQSTESEPAGVDYESMTDAELEAEFERLFDEMVKINAVRRGRSQGQN